MTDWSSAFAPKQLAEIPMIITTSLMETIMDPAAIMTAGAIDWAGDVAVRALNTTLPAGEGIFTRLLSAGVNGFQNAYMFKAMSKVSS
jgi:hypothetical protein